MDYEEILRALQLGKDTKNLKRLRRDPWENVRQGIYLVIALEKVLFASTRPTNASFKLVTRCLSRIRDTSVHLTPEKVQEIGSIQLEYWTQEVESGSFAFSRFIFGMKDENASKRQAVRRIEVLLNAYSSLPPFSPGDPAYSKEEMDDLSEGVAILFGSIVDSFSVDFTWIRFLEAVAEEEEGALKAFQKILLGHALMKNPVEWEPFDQSPYSEDPRKQTTGEAIELFTSYLYGSPEGSVKMPVPRNLEEKIREKAELFVSQLIEEEEQVRPFLGWYQERREELLSVKGAMWDDILNRSEYGLRDNGYDHVAVKLPTHAWENIQFFPEAFPKVSVRFWGSFQGIRIFYTEIIGPEIRTNRVLPEDTLEMENVLFSELSEFIAVQSYWEIVMGNSKQEAPEDGTVGTGRKMGERGGSVVRPHIRRLPEGSSASSEARELAQEVLGVSLRPGTTFVRQHEHGWSEIDNVPPAFTFTKKHLQTWG